MSILTLTKIILLIIGASTQIFAHEVIFETQEELAAIGATSTCFYFENYEEVCKKSPAHPGSLGFWSSCENDSACDIIIPVGKIDGNATDELPTHVRITSYLLDSRAEIRIRYKLTPGSMALNLNPPVPGAEDWTTSPYYDLESIVGFNAESEVIIRISSNPFAEDSDLLDKIIFNFQQTSDPPLLSTTEGPICFE